jgi:hypothetical protein
MKIRWFLLFSLCSFFFSVMFAQAERIVSKTFPLDDDGSIIIDTYKGSIRVDVWDKEEIFMEARIELDEDTEDAEEAVALVDIDVSSRQSSFRIETSYDRLNRRRERWWNIWQMELPSVHYTLHIPEHASLVIEDYKSDSKIIGLTGDLTFETYKGEARILDHEGDVRVETYKGDVRVGFRSEAHTGRFKTYKGDIAVELPERSGFDIRIEMGRRAGLSSDFDVDDGISNNRRSGTRIRDSINGGGPLLSFESTKGSLRIDAR